MIEVFGKAEAYEATGCWALSSVSKAYVRVMEWRAPIWCGKAALFERSDSKFVVRHHPEKCESVRLSKNQHLNCVRPSHLSWGTYSDNVKDIGIRKALLASQD